MSGGLVNPHGPERQAVIAADKAVANFEESDPTLAKHHQAQTAVANAWSPLNDAGIISGGKVIRHKQRFLVERNMEAHRRLVIRNSEVGYSYNDYSDIGVLFDEKRMAIPTRARR